MLNCRETLYRDDTAVIHTHLVRDIGASAPDASGRKKVERRYSPRVLTWGVVKARPMA
jgi:hypothetical protein